MASASPYKGSVLGRLLADLIAGRDMTQGQLAALAGVTQQTVSKWIKGEISPRPRRIKQLERLLETGDGALLAVAFEDHDPPSAGPKQVPATMRQRLAALEERFTALEARVDNLLERFPPERSTR